MQNDETPLTDAAQDWNTQADAEHDATPGPDPEQGSAEAAMVDLPQDDLPTDSPQEPGRLSHDRSAIGAMISFGLFDGNSELVSEYQARKSEIVQSHLEYLAEHPELRALLSDYMQMMMHRKPDDVYSFTREFFTS
ncbi:hypothetical protein HK105_201646 [Polyrhizophydium stewartii]|uniref:RIIa domain-containing protein n=1 Tax=Polyrhizophydium stewartii TaxID=2732419 RepID=A0ABR4NH21_9FUNG|nr:hypothetical protein HK105_005567 [Polyrhizophydium stewartii]